LRQVGNPCRASARLLELSQGYGEAPGALTSGRRGSWSTHKPSARVLVPSQAFDEGVVALAGSRRGLWSPRSTLAMILVFVEGGGGFGERREGKRQAAS